MFKKIIIGAIGLLCVTLASHDSFAKTKYDAALEHNGWKQAINHQILDNPVFKSYLDLLLTGSDLDKISQSLDKQKAEFIRQNKDSFLRYLQFVLFSKVVAKIAPNSTEAEMIYVTGVIKDPKAQAARTGPEYETEKQVLRELPLYKIWEGIRKGDFLKTFVDEQLDIIENALKQK